MCSGLCRNVSEIGNGIKKRAGDSFGYGLQALRFELWNGRYGADATSGTGNNKNPTKHAVNRSRNTSGTKCTAPRKLSSSRRSRREPSAHTRSHIPREECNRDSEIR